MSTPISDKNRQTHDVFRKTLNRRETSKAKNIGGMEEEFSNDEVTLRNQSASAESQRAAVHYFGPRGMLWTRSIYLRTTHHRNDGPESPQSETETGAATSVAWQQPLQQQIR
jgi:hypothetical protein